jgi:hypothetical protein
MHTYSLPFLVYLCLATQLATAQSTSAQPFCAVEPQAVQLLDFTQNTLAVTSAGAEVQHNQGYHIKFTETEGHVIWSAPKGGWHWSEYVGIGIDLKNESDRTIRLVGQLEDRPNSGSFILLPPQTEDRLVLYLRRKGLPEDSSFADMRGIPGGHMAHWSIPDSNRIRSFQLHDIDGCGLNATITVKAIYGLGKHGVLSHPGSDSFFPFINAYGQYKHGNWPGKIHSDSDLQTAATTEQSDLTTHPGPDDRSQYGGWINGPRLKATGHFRTEKHQGKWWLVDPEGYLFWSHGVTGVGGGALTTFKGRKHYFEAIPKAYIQSGHSVDFYKANIAKKYGNDWLNKSQALAHQRIRSWGMNTLGNWSDRDVCANQRTPYVLPIHYNHRNGAAWKDPELLRKKLRARLAQESAAAQDPWCIGFFVDNELRWNEVMPPEDYFRIVYEEMRRAAPNKLYLGSRLHGEIKPEPARASAKYCDVIGVNRYRFSPSDLKIEAAVDKPIIIGEFHFGALDRGMLHPGLRGVGNQQQRNYAYRHYVTQALTHPNIVGTHWFQYREQAMSGRKDGENFQIGFVDIADTPYPELITAARWIGEHMYPLRAKP